MTMLPTQIKMHEGNKNHPKGTVKRGFGKHIQEGEKEGEQKRSKNSFEKIFALYWEKLSYEYSVFPVPL